MAGIFVWFSRVFELDYCGINSHRKGRRFFNLLYLRFCIEVQRRFLNCLSVDFPGAMAQILLWALLTSSAQIT